MLFFITYFGLYGPYYTQWIAEGFQGSNDHPSKFSPEQTAATIVIIVCVFTTVSFTLGCLCFMHCYKKLERNANGIEDMHEEIREQENFAEYLL